MIGFGNQQQRPGASDKSSDLNGPRQQQTERDGPRRRYPSCLRQSDRPRLRRTKQACMVRRRSTVRFRNGAPARTVKFEKIRTGIRRPVGTNGCPQGPHWPPSEPLGLAMPAARGQPVRSRAPGNQGNRAPDRPAPVTAHPDMRRCLTGPSPDGPSPHDRGRSRAGPAQPAGAGATARPGHGGESAGDGHPYHAHVRVARARGAGRPGSRPSARRRPGGTAVGTGRSSGAGPGIASRPDPGRGHRLGHGARASGGRGRHRARAARASGLRPRRRLMPGAAGLVPGHAARRRRPRCAAAPPGRDGGRQSRLPAGQQPA